MIADPMALRALAHPLRLRLHALVGREGAITAAEAARRLGVSQALASHHLRQLAKYGYVEPAEAGDQRERPWRVTTTSARYEPGESDDDEGWADRTGISQNLVHLTAEEMAEFNRAWDALITPLVRRRPLGAGEKRPAGTVPVDITLVVTRLRATEPGPS